LEECIEYEDSLEATLAKYKDLINTGKEVEQSLKGVISQKDQILEESDALTIVLTEDNKKKKKKLKLFKSSTQILGGAVFVLLLVLLI
jgi:hypothetical protein